MLCTVVCIAGGEGVIHSAHCYSQYEGREAAPLEDRRQGGYRGVGEYPGEGKWGEPNKGNLQGEN